MLKGIKICADCANYNLKKHKCKICKDEGKPTDPFYADCPLPDVEEVRHGEWLNGNRFQSCSECKKRGKKSWHYCPNCGAKMDGKE